MLLILIYIFVFSVVEGQKYNSKLEKKEIDITKMRRKKIKFAY